MAQATCRVPPALDGALDEAADEIGLFRSDVMRRALLWYIKTNPDGLEVFDGRSVPGMGRSLTVGGVMDDTGESTPRGVITGSTYDPMDEV